MRIHVSVYYSYSYYLISGMDPFIKYVSTIVVSIKARFQ